MNPVAAFDPSIRSGALNAPQPIVQPRDVQPHDVEPAPVQATVVFANHAIEHVLLIGDDGARFNRIKDHLGDQSVLPLSISDQDGPAAIGWVGGTAASRGLTANAIAGALVDAPVNGPMVITGLGRGEDDCMTSVHEGLRLVLERMAREA